MRLTQRGAVITGANQGLGQVIAETFVREGASVVITARNAELLGKAADKLTNLATAPGQVVVGVAGDVSDPSTCEKLVAAARVSLPRLDILVNNAGVCGPMGKIEDVAWDDWLETVRINLFGTAHMCRAALPRMRAQSYGKIINLSGGGATSPLPNRSAYAASKAAVVRLTETLALETRGTGIDVNAIAPGAINTRMLDQALAAGPESLGAESYQQCIKQQNTGGTPPERGASLAVFLASAESDGITGRLISAVWDDWKGLANRRDVLARTDVFTLRRIVPEDRRDQWFAA